MFIVAIGNAILLFAPEQNRSLFTTCLFVHFSLDGFAA